MHSRDLGFFAFACTLAMLTPSGAIATPASDAMSVVQQFDSAFNKGDAKGAVALCTSPASILDDFAPHTWTGASACADWMSGYEAWAKQNDVTGGTVTLGKPWHVDITGNRAYIVLPTTYTYKTRGKTVIMSGNLWTVVLVKTSATWRITAWAWADGR